jgi:hypothetical protein
MVQLNIDFEVETPPIVSSETDIIPLSDIFEAYYSCRKNKRYTANALKFELNYEENLLQLWREINDGTYIIGRSITFIVEQPVKREIFAADFRDRVVHHLLTNKFLHLFEKDFIYDSYSCRKGRGTLFGVKRVSRFMRACSDNYTRDCYFLKMDIKGFFMSIRRDILFDKLYELIGCNYHEPDRDLLLQLVHQVVMNDCTDDCTMKSPRRKWDNLPKDKSLFGRKHRGIPIGNLTSQIFGNFYLSSLDHYIKSELGVRYYARYVDDFVLFHSDKAHLAVLRDKIRHFLREELDLEVHPKKIQLQHCKRGVRFVGSYILPHRVYIEQRTKANFYKVVRHWNYMARVRKHKFNADEIAHIMTSANSYLGYMRHYRTFRLRKKILHSMSARFDGYLRPANGYTKLRVVERVITKKDDKEI